MFYHICIEYQKFIDMRLSSLLIILIITLSCGKDTDTTKSAITMIKPNSNDTFRLSPDSVLVNFKVQDNGGLQKIQVNVTTASGTSMYSDTENTSDNEYQYVSSIKFTGFSTLTPMTLKVTAINKQQNSTETTTTFYVKP